MMEGDPKPVRRSHEALGQAVGKFADPAQHWMLVVQCCGSCAKRRDLVSDLVPVLPPEMTWAEMLATYRCKRCGARAEIVGLSGPPAMPGDGGTWLLLQCGLEPRM